MARYLGVQFRLNCAVANESVAHACRRLHASAAISVHKAGSIFGLVGSDLWANALHLIVLIFVVSLASRLGHRKSHDINAHLRHVAARHNITPQLQLNIRGHQQSHALSVAIWYASLLLQITCHTMWPCAIKELRPSRSASVSPSKPCAHHTRPTLSCPHSRSSRTHRELRESAHHNPSPKFEPLRWCSVRRSGLRGASSFRRGEHRTLRFPFFHLTTLL